MRARPFSSVRYFAFVLSLLTPLPALSASPAFAKEIETNEVTIANAPAWLTRPKVEKVIARIQTKLEWTTRKIRAVWYTDESKFADAHGLGPLAIAVTATDGETSVIHMGPRVGKSDWEMVFGHEMVHVILRQKYKNSVPRWLEEGLANHLAKAKPVDYKALAGQSFPEDVRELSHRFSGSASRVDYNYKASQALAEMLAKKCDLENLIRLSVERKMEDYIRTYCEIPDINAAFRAWVKKKSGT